MFNQFYQKPTPPKRRKNAVRGSQGKDSTFSKSTKAASIHPKSPTKKFDILLSKRDCEDDNIFNKYDSNG